MELDKSGDELFFQVMTKREEKNAIAIVDRFPAAETYYWKPPEPPLIGQPQIVP